MAWGGSLVFDVSGDPDLFAQNGAPTIVSFSNDSGVTGDGITNDNTLTLTGTAEANSTVTVSDGATVLGSATTDGSGAWSYTTAALADGSHSFTAVASDVAGNSGATSAAFAVTIDTVAPAVPKILGYASDTGVVGDGLTSDNTLLINGTAVANSTVTVSDGNTVLGTTTANGSGAWSFTTAALADGAHNLTATASDVAGNTSAASTTLSVAIDTTPPPASGETIQLRVSGDQYDGAPQFVVLVDGQQVGDVHSISSVHDSGQWEMVDVVVPDAFSQLEIKYLNDAWGGSHATDRNLWVDWIEINGVADHAHRGELRAHRQDHHRRAEQHGLGRLAGVRPQRPHQPVPAECGVGDRIQRQYPRPRHVGGPDASAGPQPGLGLGPGFAAPIGTCWPC